MNRVLGAKHSDVQWNHFSPIQIYKSLKNLEMHQIFFMCSKILFYTKLTWCFVFFVFSAQFEIVGGNRRWGSLCTYDFYSNTDSKEGRFFSPKYPQNYPPGSNCQYVFYGMKNERVKVTFENIQLENIDGRWVNFIHKNKQNNNMIHVCIRWSSQTPWHGVARFLWLQETAVNFNLALLAQQPSLKDGAKANSNLRIVFVSFWLTIGFIFAVVRTAQTTWLFEMAWMPSHPW